MYPENLEGTQVIVGSMNMGNISTRNRTHNLFHPKREPIPLGHSDYETDGIHSYQGSQPIASLISCFHFLFFFLVVYTISCCLYDNWPRAQFVQVQQSNFLFSGLELNLFQVQQSNFLFSDLELNLFKCNSLISCFQA